MNASNNGQFWARDFEMLTRAERQKLEAPLLAQQIAYVYANSAYYRRKFDEAGVRSETVTTEQALDQGPFTEKSAITESQTKGSMLGPHQCASFDDVVRIVATGGSSGPPTRLGWTRSDIDLYNEMGARALWTMGCRPSNLVIIVSTTACTRAASWSHGFRSPRGRHPRPWYWQLVTPAESTGRAASTRSIRRLRALRDTVIRLTVE